MVAVFGTVCGTAIDPARNTISKQKDTRRIRFRLLRFQGTAKYKSCFGRTAAERVILLSVRPKQCYSARVPCPHLLRSSEASCPTIKQCCPRFSRFTIIPMIPGSPRKASRFVFPEEAIALCCFT